MSSARSSFLRENFGIKLLSLGLAVLLEIYFYSPDNSLTASVIANVEFGAIPPATIIVEPPNFGRGLSAEVQVRGPKSLIDQVRSTNHRMQISVPPGITDEFTAVLDATQLSLPNGVEAVRIKPERIRVRFEKEAVKELLVIADKVGEAQAGYRLKSINIFPDSVVVRGPISEVEPLQAVETKPLEIAKLMAPVRREVALKGLGPLTSVSVTMVTADINVEAIPQQRTFPQVDVEVIAPEGFAASAMPSRVTAVIEGPMQTVKQLNREQIKLSADARKLSGGKHELALTPTLPEGISLLKTEPAMVAVAVEAPVAKPDSSKSDGAKVEGPKTESAKDEPGKAEQSKSQAKEK